jgi:hypothetical protein
LIQIGAYGDVQFGGAGQSLSTSRRSPISGHPRFATARRSPGSGRHFVQVTTPRFISAQQRGVIGGVG